MYEEKFIQLNIAFRMPEDVAQKAMKLSREIAEKEDAYFVLDGIDYFPHSTNYAVEFPEKNLDKIVETVEKLCAKFSPIEFHADKNKADQGWIGVYFDYSQDLKNIHQEFVEKLNPLRENKIRDKFKTSTEFSLEEEQKNIAEYGHPLVMTLYEPHLTITKLKGGAIAEKIAMEMSWPIEKFKIDTIGIFVGGEHGTCRKLIREFKLGK